MTEVTSLVGEIRMFVQSVDRTAQPQMATRAAELSRACAEVNERLNRCAGYLRQGLRSEALQLARTAPDLLDQVAVLDFPERAEWDELALTHGWPKAAPLAIDLAEAINEAYALEDPLEDLLRSHRRLALARAPLAARLAVMRQIGALDVNNMIWAEDVRRFESARFEQIEHEVRAARAQLDGVALGALATEVETAGWLSTPPESVVSATTEAVGYVKREEARKAMRSLLTPLDQARIANDAVLGRRLRQRWLSLLEDAGLTSRDVLRGEAQVALDWLAGEDRREQHESDFRLAVDDLEQAIDGGAPEPVLASLEQTARGFGLNFPAELETKLRDQYRHLGRSARRRNQWVLATVGGTTLLLVACVAWSNSLQKREQEVRQQVAQIESLVESGHLEAARSALDKLEATYRGVSEEDGVAPVVVRLDGAEKEQTDRQARFSSALAEAQDAPVFQADVPSLATARSLARSDAEKAQVERLTSTRKAALENERARLGREIQGRLETVRETLASVESNLERAPQDPVALANLRKTLREIEENARPAAEAVRAEVAAFIKRVDEAEKERVATGERQRLLADVARDAGAIRQSEDVEAFVSACRRYKEKFPAEARSKDLARVGENQAAWERVVAWSALARGWVAPVTSLTPKASRERLQQFSALGDDLTKYPEQERLSRYRQYVESRARLAAPGDENPIAQVQRLLANPLVKSVYRITTEDGRTFYSLKEPKDTPAGTRIAKLINIDCLERQQFIHQSIVRTQGLAPQTELAKRVAKVLDRLSETPEQWDGKMIEILNLIRKEPEIDPVLKVVLLKGCLQAASRGDTCLEEAVKAHTTRIEQARLNLNVPWVDPDDERARQEREKARDLLAQFPSFDGCAQGAEKARQKLEAEAGLYYVPVGFLLKSRDGKLQCRTAAKGLKRGELWVLGSKGSWARVGEWKGSGEEVDIAPGSDDLQEGQLVFAQHGAP